MPKSSIEKRTPLARKVSMVLVATSSWPIRVDSVISSVSEPGVDLISLQHGLDT